MSYCGFDCCANINLDGSFMTMPVQALVAEHTKTAACAALHDFSHTVTIPTKPAQESIAHLHYARYQYGLRATALVVSVKERREEQVEHIRQTKWWFRIISR